MRILFDENYLVERGKIRIQETGELLVLPPQDDSGWGSEPKWQC